MQQHLSGQEEASPWASRGGSCGDHTSHLRSPEPGKRMESRSPSAARWSLWGDRGAARAQCRLGDRTPGSSARRCRQGSVAVSFGHIFGPLYLWEVVTLAETTSVVLPAWRSGTTTASVRLGVPSVLQKRSGSVFLVLLLGLRYRRSLDLLVPAPSFLQSQAWDPR